MFRSRASHRWVRPALVATVLTLTSVMPAAAVPPGVTLTTAASPFEVTVNLPVAYVVKVTNGSNNALKYALVSGEISPEFSYLGAHPASSCSQLVPTCDLSGLPSGASAQVIFYFLAPSAPGTFTFTAYANFDGQTTSPPANYQNALSAPVETVVLAENVDLVRGHSVAGYRVFSTGLNALGVNNKHGTTVAVPVNAEVTVRDLPASHPLASCQGLTGEVTSLACFGEASYLSVAEGAAIPGGLQVTMRWDASDLPKGMTEKKLRIVHIFDDKTYEIVSDLCTFSGGVPTNLPCLDGPPVRLGDKDIEATVWLLRNGSARGWN
jgi:hypothetical protein